MIKYVRLILAILLAFSLNSYAQTYTLDKTLLALQKQATELPFEKVYLHMDKPYYSSGDTIWFKGYAVAGSNHTPSTISGIMYAELINSNKQIIQSLKLPVGNGLTQGSFILPVTLPGGNYHIRAYTNWMRNASDAYFFDKNIKIIKPSSGKDNVPAAAGITDVDVQFFPESGSFINGIRTKIAYKAIASNGLGINVKGVVLDEQNNEVAALTDNHLGMGYFILTPIAGKSYKVKVSYLNNQSKIFDLPVANNNGYALSIDNIISDNVDVKIIAAGSANIADVTLIAQSGGKIYFAGKGSADKSTLIASIPKSRFPSGIIQFTLLSAEGEALNERLIFIQNPDLLNISLNTVKSTYAPREKVAIDLNVKTPGGLPVVGSFSVAVVNETDVAVNELTENTILSNLLLTSDIKGYVEQPNYYFTNVSKKTIMDLDALMLTQGYHRFDWKKLRNSEMPVITYAPEDELIISGKLVTNSNKPVARGKVSLLSTEGGAMLDTITNNQGHFVFDRLTFADSTRMVLQGLNSNGNDNVKVLLDDNAPPSTTTSIIPDNLNNELDQTYIARNKKIYDDKLKYGIIADRNSTLLNEVKIVGMSVEEEKKRALAYSSNLNGPGNADQIIYADNLLIGCTDFMTCLTGRLTGVERIKDSLGNDIFVSLRSSRLGQSNTSVGMAVIYNGIFIYPGQVGGFLRDLNMSTISTVEVLRTSTLLATYGSKGGNGLIIITSKHGADINLDYVKSSKVLKFTPKGYYRTREFYSPKYDVANAQKPDFRTTIYWKPMIQTNKDGYDKLEYFNADKGTYRVVVEGINNEGQIGRQVYRYKVE